MDRAPPARGRNGPASIAEREGRARGETASCGTASGGKVRLGDNPSRQLGPVHRGPGTNPAVSCFTTIYDDLPQPIPAPGIVAIETTVANSSRCAVPQQSPWPAGDFSYDCISWGERGGRLTRQPMGTSVDTAIMMTVLNTNHVGSRSFSSRGCAFRCTHTSADPVRLLCIRLALPLTLSLASRFAPSARPVVGATPCALWLSGDYSWDCMFREKRGGGLTG